MLPTMMPLTNCYKAITLLAIVGQVFAVEREVQLSYGSFVGTPLSNGISQWLGMPFAAPPIGNLRFAPPIDPPMQTQSQVANKVSLHDLTQRKIHVLRSY